MHNNFMIIHVIEKQLQLAIIFGSERTATVVLEDCCATETGW